jgi:hypothetical protein
MTKDLRLGVSVGLLFVMVSACRTRPVNDDAQVKHIAGQLSRPNQIKLTPETCYYDKMHTSSGRKDVNQYLQKIFERITSANRDVFTGPYAAENFCISNAPENYINAFASPHGRIMFTDKMVLSAIQDATIAFVMAHEAAHILMQHSAMTVIAGKNSYVDHPWLANNQEWQNFTKDHLAKNPDSAQKLADAQTVLNAASKQREDFIAPIRRFLSPATREIETRGRAILDNLNKKAMAINSDVEKLTQELAELKQSPYYTNMSDDEKRALEEYYAARISAVLEASPVLIYGVATARKELDKINKSVDEESGRALSSSLGGVLGKQWKKINDEYTSAKMVVDSLIADDDFNSKTLMDKASQLIGYDYNRYNWMEAEADQVGLELFMRAGFSPQGSEELFKILIQSVADLSGDNEKKKNAVPECLTRLSELKSGSRTDLPERGRLSHPESCWRLINTQYTELKLHADHYQSLLKNAHDVEVFPGLLTGIKAAPVAQ